MHNGVFKSEIAGYTADSTLSNIVIYLWGYSLEFSRTQNRFLFYYIRHLKNDCGHFIFLRKTNTTVVTSRLKMTFSVDFPEFRKTQNSGPSLK